MSHPKNKHSLATRVIHAGQKPDPSTGDIMTPIYASSTYVQKSPGDHQGWEFYLCAARRSGPLARCNQA